MPAHCPSFWPQVLHDCQRYRSNIREIGDLWVGVRTASSSVAELRAASGLVLSSPLQQLELSLGLAYRLSTSQCEVVALLGLRLASASIRQAR